MTLGFLTMATLASRITICREEQASHCVVRGLPNYALCQNKITHFLLQPTLADVDMGLVAVFVGKLLISTLVFRIAKQASSQSKIS